MSKNMGMRITGTLVTLAALAACADSPSAPGAVLQAKAPSLAVVGGTPPTTIAALEGEVWVCKVANAGAPADAFGFTVSATPLGTNSPPLAPDAFSLMPGECAIVYDLTSAGGQLYDVTITEGAVPSAEWAFTSAVETFAAPGPAPIISGQSITSRISNDRGAVITFTNTYTPPPPPGPSCTLTQGYWKTHQEQWDAAGEMVVWNGETFFNSGKTYAEIYATSAAGGNSYIQLAHQYIAAVLNLNGGSDPVIDAAVAQAAALLGGHTAGSSFIKDATWTALATTLDNYNKGTTGPGHCD
jgi:hypothetical protein